jgi:hypothetical protein
MPAPTFSHGSSPQREFGGEAFEVRRQRCDGHARASASQRSWLAKAASCQRGHVLDRQWLLGTDEDGSAHRIALRLVTSSDDLDHID